MGVNAEIYFKCRDGGDFDFFNEDCRSLRKKFDEFPELFPKGATHVVVLICNNRYYSEDYARGLWCKLCPIIMELIASEDVEAVWYFGDCEESENQKPISIDDVLRISRFYMENGNKPYENLFYQQERNKQC